MPEVGQLIWLRFPLLSDGSAHHADIYIGCMKNVTTHDQEIMRNDSVRSCPAK